MASKTYFFSAASTYLAKSGTGTVYGFQVGDPAAGGSVVISDLLNAGAAPNLAVASTFGPSIIGHVKFPASPQPIDVNLHGRRFTDGLTVSITSTQGVLVHYD